MSRIYNWLMQRKFDFWHPITKRFWNSFRIKITTLKKIKKLQCSRHWWNPIDLLFSFTPSNQIYLCIMQRLTFLKVKSFLQFYAKSALLCKTIIVNSLKGKRCNNFVFLKQLYRWNGSLWEELYNKTHHCTEVDWYKQTKNIFSLL